MGRPDRVVRTRVDGVASGRIVRLVFKRLLRTRTCVARRHEKQDGGGKTVRKPRTGHLMDTLYAYEPTARK